MAKKKQAVRDSKDYAIVKNALRKAFMYSHMRRDVLAKARFSRGLYTCANCTELFPQRQCQVDHIKEVAVDAKKDLRIRLATLTGRMFNPPNLQVLCKSCHAKKTLFK